MRDNAVKNVWKRTGIVLFVLSWVLYGMVFAVPFMPFSPRIKVIMVPLFIVLGEMAFWASCVIIGKEFIQRFKRYLNPTNWLKR